MPKAKKERLKKDSSVSKTDEQFSPSNIVNYDQNLSLDIATKISSICNNAKNYFNHWNKINKEGNDVCKLIISVNTSDGESRYNDIFKLQELYVTLEGKFKELEELYKKWKESIKKITLLIELNNFQMKSTNGKEVTTNEMIEFTTLASQLDILYTASQEILSAYEQELKLKTLIIENLALESNADNLQFMEICWFYQPFIDDSVQFAFSQILLQNEQNPL